MFRYETTDRCTVAPVMPRPRTVCHDPSRTVRLSSTDHDGLLEQDLHQLTLFRERRLRIGHKQHARRVRHLLHRHLSAWGRITPHATLVDCDCERPQTILMRESNQGSACGATW